MISTHWLTLGEWFIYFLNLLLKLFTEALIETFYRNSEVQNLNLFQNLNLRTDLCLIKELNLISEFLINLNGSNWAC